MRAYTMDVAFGGSPARRVRLSTALDVCAFVDGLEADEMGELRVTHDDATAGAIFVEGRRVCWAAARGLGRRLTDLLVARAGIDAASMDRHFVRCREAGTPLGEDLVERGILSAGALRAALLEHSAESLARLCAGSATATWLARTRGYSPRFTFTTAEMLAATQSLAAPDVAGSAGRVLAENFAVRAGDWGAAFARQPGQSGPLPIAIAGAFPESAAELLQHAEASISALDVLATVGAPDLLLAAESERVRCAFRLGSCTYVGETSAAGAMRLVARGWTRAE